MLEYVAGGSALVGVVPVKTAWVAQAADDFIDQDLRRYPQGNIGIAVLLRGRDADGMIPLLVTVQKNKPNSLPPGRRQCVPDIAAGSAAAAVQGYVPVNRVPAGTGRIVAPRLNAVQRFIRMGDTAIPSKVPAHVLDISRPGRAASVGFIGAGHLVVQPGSVVAVPPVQELPVQVNPKQDHPKLDFPV